MSTVNAYSPNSISSYLPIPEQTNSEKPAQAIPSVQPDATPTAKSSAVAALVAQRSIIPKPLDLTQAGAATSIDEVTAGSSVSNPWDLTQAEIDALKKLASEHQRQIPAFSESDDPKVREQEKEAFTKVLLEEAQRAKKEIYDKTGKVADFSDSKPGSIASFLANNVALARTKFYTACQELGLPFDQGQDYDMIKMQVDKFVSNWIQNT